MRKGEGGESEWERRRMKKRKWSRRVWDRKGEEEENQSDFKRRKMCEKSTKEN